MLKIAACLPSDQAALKQNVLFISAEMFCECVLLTQGDSL